MLKKFFILSVVFVALSACTPAPTPTPQPTLTPLPTATALPTATPTLTATATATGTPTLPPTATRTETPKPTATATATSTPTPMPVLGTVDIPGIGKVDLDKAVQFTTDNARSLPVDLIDLYVDGQLRRATMVRIGETETFRSENIPIWSERTVLFDALTGEKFRIGINLMNGQRVPLMLVDNPGGQVKVVDSGVTAGGGDLAKLKDKVIFMDNRLHAIMVGPGQAWDLPRQIFVMVAPGTLK